MPWRVKMRLKLARQSPPVFEQSMGGGKSGLHRAG